MPREFVRWKSFAYLPRAQSLENQDAYWPQRAHTMCIHCRDSTSPLSDRRARPARSNELALAFPHPPRRESAMHAAIGDVPTPNASDERPIHATATVRRRKPRSSRSHPQNEFPDDVLHGALDLIFRARCIDYSKAIRFRSGDFEILRTHAFKKIALFAFKAIARV